MRLTWIGFGTIFVLFGIVDAWMLFHLRHQVTRIKNAHFFVSGIALLLLTWLFQTHQHIDKPNQIIQFQYITLWLTAAYTAKLLYLFWHSSLYVSGRIWERIPASRHWNDRLHKPQYPILTRRKFVSQMGIVMASAPFFSLLMGWAKGRFNFQVRYQKLSFPNLPEAFEGFRIVQISDLHLGSFNSSHQELAQAFEMIQSEKPDLICFTGDLVNNFARETEGFEEVFELLEAPMGKFSILGNHDYGKYSRWENQKAEQQNFEEIVNAHSRLGFQLLRNHAATITRQGESIAIAGVENWGHPPFPQYADLTKATAQWDSQIPFSILLTHDPDHWDAEVAGHTNYDLTLAGHTHGMQMGVDYKGLQWSPARYKFKRWAGLYQKNNQFLYVNRGLGVMGLPARIGMPPEITLIELTKGSLGNAPN